MYQLCDITGYTFLYSIENTKCKSSNATFSSQIVLNTIILILLLFMRTYSKDLL